jgi:rsbT co-antagonist protein RsbR
MMNQSMSDAVQHDNARLRERVAELEQENNVLAQERDAHRQGEARLQAILESMTDNVLVWDAAYDYLYANQAAINHVGTTRDQVIGKNMRDGLGHIPEFMRMWMQRVDHVLATNEPLHSEDAAMVGEKKVYSESILSPMRGPDNKPVAAALVYRDITERKQQEEELRMFKAMVDTAPDGFGIADQDGVLIYANAAYQAMTGYGADLIGMRFTDHFSDEHRPEAVAAITQTNAQDTWRGLLHFQRSDGSQVPVEATGFVIRDEQEHIKAMIGLFRDISESQRIEQERQALQQQVIDAQRSALRELSTPLIPITDNVVIMPLVGTIDSQRAQQVMEALLEGVAHHQASLVIIDITGVSVVDTQVAQAFIQAAQAVRLLGAQVMLTGIQPQIAQTLVQLGVDLSGIRTQGSLQAGIAAALK